MMKNNTTKFNTLDDMVSYVLSNTSRSETRWNLRDNRDLVPVDKEAWDLWYKGKPAWKSEYSDKPKMSEIEWAQYEEAVELHSSLEPEKVYQNNWWLQESNGDSWHTDLRIELSEELGNLLDSVWKKGTRGRYSTYVERQGAVTIPGLLKRLGKTEIKSQLDESKKRAEELRAKNNRNAVRSRVERLAKELAKELEEDQKRYGLEFSDSLKELCEVNLQNEI
jgi:hypothetical protein